jgi:hypothetical protein
MNNIKSDGVKRNRQRGGALILVLIALSVGSLIIVPTLDYVYTGLKRVPISERLLMEQYSADAAIEYGLWQLAYGDNTTDDLSPDNPDEDTIININGENLTLNTSISMSPASDNGSFSVPAPESGIHLAVGMDILPPVWTKAGNKAYLTHVIYIYNYGTASTHLKGLFQELDPRLTYLNGSYEGPAGFLTKTPPGDCWTLYWEFTEPLPKVNSQDWMVITFTTWTLDDMGEQEYGGSGWVEYAAFQEDQKESYDGDSGPASFGLYDLTVDAGSCTMLVNVGVTETGEIVIRSWQVE